MGHESACLKLLEIVSQGQTPLGLAGSHKKVVKLLQEAWAEGERSFQW